jgi:hypothetical protein
MSVLADVRLGHEAVSNDSKKGVVFFTVSFSMKTVFSL